MVIGSAWWTKKRLDRLIKAFNRGDTIRTCDLVVPNDALYQAELHPGWVNDF